MTNYAIPKAHIYVDYSVKKANSLRMYFQSTPESQHLMHLSS